MPYIIDVYTYIYVHTVHHKRTFHRAQMSTILRHLFNMTWIHKCMNCLGRNLEFFNSLHWEYIIFFNLTMLLLSYMPS